MRGRALVVLAAAAATAGAAAGAQGGGSSAAPPSRIVFSSNRAADLYPQLFRVGLDGSGRTQLTDPTVAVEDPALSPDRTELAYAAGRELRVHNVGTGAERVIVSLTGESIRLPRWSADGRSIAYFADAPQPDGSATSIAEVVAATGGPARSLGPAQWGSGLAWRPDGGEVAYARFDGTVLALVATRTDGSGSRPLTPVAFGAPDVAWSPDGATVVYTDVIRALYAVPSAGGTPTRLAESSAFDPVFSPDGTRVAFAVHRGPADSHFELATIRPDGSDEHVLTSNSADDRYPSWSPDGTQLLESRLRDGSAAVVAVAVDGSGERVVEQETPGTYSLVPFWGADGSSILYVAGLLYNDRELYSVRPSGAGLRRLTHNRADDSDPAVSRDGRWIAFDRAPFDPTRFHTSDLYVMRSDGTRLRRLTNTPKSSETAPAWSPDGRRLAFVRTGAQGITRLVVLDLARGTQRTITPRGTLLAQPSWSSDGRWIAFTAYDHGPQVDTVRPDGRSRRTIVPAVVDSHNVGHGGSAPAWAPRGSRIAYLAGINTFREVYTWSLAVRAANGSRRLLAHDLHGDRPAWSPDGATLAYSTGSDLWSVPASGRGKPRLLQHAPGVSDEPSWQRLR